MCSNDKPFPLRSIRLSQRDLVRRWRRFRRSNCWSVACVQGGPIPAGQDPKTHQVVPLQATWRVRFGDCENGRTLAANSKEPSR
jgi:hypothetical protein